MSVDPLADQYSSFTPYGYVANNPLKLIDPDGMRIEYAEDMNKEDKKALKKHFRYLRKNSDTFKKAWRDLKKSDHTHTIHSSSDRFGVDPADQTYPKEGTGSDIYVNPDNNPIDAPQEAALAHEIGHSWRMDQGLEPTGTKTQSLGEQVSPENFVFSLKSAQYREFEGTHFENVVRSELGLPLREQYGEMNDNHTGNVTVTQFTKTRLLDFSKQRKVMIGRDKSYNYKGGNHYSNLRKRRGSRYSLNLTKYTDATKYN